MALRPRRRAAAFALLTLILASGCGFGGLGDLFDSGFYVFPGEDPCYAAGTVFADVAGEWSLTGSGERSECGIESLDTARFELSSRGVLAVAQDGGALELSSPRDGFSLSGSVDGVCVEFTTTEVDNDISFDWSGTVENNVITGTFTGYGPSACLSEGDFTLIID